MAEVIRFNANLEALEGAVAFSAEFTPGGGILLIKTERAQGTSPETISIDPFVFPATADGKFFHWSCFLVVDSRQPSLLNSWRKQEQVHSGRQHPGALGRSEESEGSR